MIYAHLEENTNRIIGWYSDTLHDEIPTPNIEVSSIDYIYAINNDHNYYNPDKDRLEYYDFEE